MLDRRALPGTIAGVLGLGFAVAAVATRSVTLLAVAAACTALSVVLALTMPDHLPLRWRERKVLRDQAQRLALENDRMAARAARFEAEAISARQKLAAAMLAEHARIAGGNVASGGGAATEAGSVGVGGPGGLPSEDELRTELSRSSDHNPSELVTDPITGVFTQVFFDASLGKRISAARRGLRPLTVALVEVVTRVGEPEQRPAESQPVADILVATLREADTVARLDSGLFAVLLEDTPENGAIWTLERIRRRISEDLPGCTVRAGLSCYPAYAFDATQIMDQALGALDAAREWRQDRIEVTTANPDD